MSAGTHVKHLGCSPQLHRRVCRLFVWSHELFGLVVHYRFGSFLCHSLWSQNKKQGCWSPRYHYRHTPAVIHPVFCPKRSFPVVVHVALDLEKHLKLCTQVLVRFGFQSFHRDTTECHIWNCINPHNPFRVDLSRRLSFLKPVARRPSLVGLIRTDQASFVISSFVPQFRTHPTQIQY